MATYTITVKTAEELADLNGMHEGVFAAHAEQTFAGFKRIPDDAPTMFAGAYEGMIDGEEYIFLADEVALAVEE